MIKISRQGALKEIIKLIELDLIEKKVIRPYIIK
jgi:hypothetical protein